MCTEIEAIIREIIFCKFLPHKHNTVVQSPFKKLMCKYCIRCRPCDYKYIWHNARLIREFELPHKVSWEITLLFCCCNCMYNTKSRNHLFKPVLLCQCIKVMFSVIHYRLFDLQCTFKISHLQLHIYGIHSIRKHKSNTSSNMRFCPSMRSVWLGIDWVLFFFPRFYRSQREKNEADIQPS